MQQSGQYHDVFGYVGPTVSPRRIISSAPDQVDEDLADLDALLIEHGLPARAQPAPPAAQGDDTASQNGDQEQPSATDAPRVESPQRQAPDQTAPDEVPAAARICPMPWSHFNAGLQITKMQGLMKQLSGRSRWLVPDQSSWIALGAGSDFSSKSITTKEQEHIEHIRKSRSRFPSRFSMEPTEETSASVSLRKPAGLPRWKDKAKPEKASRSQNETLLGIRVASLVVRGVPTLADLTRFTDSQDIGFFSLALPPHLVDKFTESGAGNDVITRGLMRRLETLRASRSGVFAWRREEDGGITLFGALANAGYSDDFALALSGRRFGRSLVRAGVSVANFRDIEPETFARLYGLPSEAFGRGWADRRAHRFIEDHPDAVDPIEFDFDAKRFRSRQEVNEWTDRSEGIWSDYVSRCGLPGWFGGGFLEILLDVLVRTPDAARRHRHAEETVGKWMEKQSKKDAAKVEIEEIDKITLDTLRFYRGSPAEFAALALAEGELLGIYCPAEFLNAGKDLYELLRKA